MQQGAANAPFRGGPGFSVELLVTQAEQARMIGRFAQLLCSNSFSRIFSVSYRPVSNVKMISLSVQSNCAQLLQHAQHINLCPALNDFPGHKAIN